jgi:hypothetical protein
MCSPPTRPRRRCRLAIRIGQEFFYDCARDRLAQEALNAPQLVDLVG